MLSKLRNQLSFWYSLGILATASLLLSLFYFSTNFVFYAQVDTTLKTHVGSLVSSLGKDQQIAGCGCLSPTSTLLLGVLQMPGMPTAILNEKGTVLKASADFPPNYLKPPPPIGGFPIFNTVFSGQTYRFFSQPILLENKTIGWVLMGHPIDAFLKTRSVLLIFIIAIMIVIFIPVILLGRYLANKALTKEKEFLADLTHSLKTPLTVLQAQIENSQINPSSLLPQIKKLTSLVNETLVSNYLANDQKNVKTDLTSLLEELCEITQVLGLKKKITLKKNFNAESLWVKGNKQNLAKAILSILENAVVYSKNNGQITISLKKEKQIVLTITDYGLGINQKDLPFVFNRFYRGQGAKIPGHGLGLAIAKNIIEELGGGIYIKSKIKKNTTVTITLPTS